MPHMCTVWSPYPTSAPRRRVRIYKRCAVYWRPSRCVHSPSPPCAIGQYGRHTQQHHTSAVCGSVGHRSDLPATARSCSVSHPAAESTAHADQTHDGAEYRLHTDHLVCCASSFSVIRIVFRVVQLGDDITDVGPSDTVGNVTLSWL